MEEKNVFFCLCANYTHYPRSQATFLLYFVHAHEASKSNSPVNKIKFFWPPFMHSIYTFYLLQLPIASYYQFSAF